MTRPPVCHHGMAKAKGCSHVAVGTFGKLFPDEAAVPPLTLTEAAAAALGGPGGAMHDYDGSAPDCAIPAGYTFFAQFVDHDVTLDTATSLREQVPADRIGKLPNIRSASLDLDCVYGFGPEGSPHLYDPERPGHVAVGDSGLDLARSPSGVALIGDPRNDENLFVSQLQLLFHKFHNRIHAERLPHFRGSAEARFEAAQTETRYHYQWLVLFDFLKRLCDRDVYRQFVTDLCKGTPTAPYVYGPGPHGLAMPVEFSVAAYRVGHTLVRSDYALNHEHLEFELFDEAEGQEGFTGIPPELAVDWRYLLPVDDCIAPRLCKAVDPRLANELQDLPLPVVPSNNPRDRALAFRNLMRGSALRLGSGQAVAAALAPHYPAIDPAFVPDVDLPDDPALADQLRSATPLFYYLLAEGAQKHQGERFGPTGSAILLEVFGGMLRYCDTSFLKAPGGAWQPDPCISKERWSWFATHYEKGFHKEALIHEDGYYPFDLADVVRFVEDGD